MGTLRHGGTIYTMQEEGHKVEAIVESDGVILETGSLDFLRATYKDQITREVEFSGVMFPGFIDSHLHIVGHGERLLRIDLTYEAVRENVLAKVKDKVATLNDGDWLIAEGFNENLWEDPTVIHLNELDEVSPNHPVVLTRVCRHALVANSKALQIAGITDDTEEPSGGVMERDSQGEIVGYFHDQAQELIKAVMPEANEAYLTHAIDTSINDLLSHGIVSGHTEDLAYYGGLEKTVRAFENVIRDKNHFRAHLLVHHEALPEFIASPYHFNKDQWVEFGAMKLFVDGALGGRTALLSFPYADDPSTSGVSIHTDEQLEALILEAREHNMPIAAHVIGDQAFENVISIIEKHPAPKGMNDRLIHGQIMRKDLIERIKGLAVSIDIQPTFVKSDFPWALERLDDRLASTSYPWKSYLEAGILCAGSSDAPIEEVNVLDGIQAAVTRQSIYDNLEYGVAEKLSVYEAISLYTVNGAKVIGKENQQGSLMEGAFADYVILDTDPFSQPVEMINQIDVLETIVNGESVYKANSELYKPEQV
ncbi:amidohydrolase [Halalkalibacillus halophilus]|uniref:amidohydrolase n=1 Tax=Halalkalibacillus halophilus TaxID=392827 RepID=UPI0003FA9CEA|nr:amidohydrolase [Halalkalibacillus halophilus]